MSIKATVAILLQNLFFFFTGAGGRGKADTSGSGQLQGVDLQVGELDGQSFGVGNAPSHVKAQHGTCPYIPKKVSKFKLF